MAVVRGSSEFAIEAAAASAHRPRSLHSAVEFRRVHGEPDEVTPLGVNRERWRYRAGLRFHGIALLLIVVPVPLLVPTGVHDVYVEVDRGRVVQVHGTLNSNRLRFGCLFGPFFALSGEDRCVARRGIPPHEVLVGSGRLPLGPAPTLNRVPTRQELVPGSTSSSTAP